MPGTLDHSTSLMEMSALENESYIDDLVKYFEAEHELHPDVDYNTENKNQAKEFHLHRYITAKHSKTGRFGAKKAKDAKDSIHSMAASGSVPEGAYFDPFGMTIIKKTNASGEEDPVALSDAQTVEQDFVNRVDEEIRLGRKNDFEAGRSEKDTQLSRLSLGQRLAPLKNAKPEKYNLDDVKIEYTAGRAFEPDEDILENTIPNQFSMDVIVDHAPPKYTMEWDQYKIDQTMGAKAHIKQFLRKIVRRKDPDEDTLFERFFVTLPEYKEIVRQGTADARAIGVEYDPDADTKLKAFKDETKKILKQHDYGDNGHSIVRMNAKKFGYPVSSYSFGFWPSTTSGAAGTIKGVVDNPDKPNKPLSASFDINYSDYLKAAAKIRGTIGSMRTYSMIGYNCTSFAVDVAQAAGVPLKDEDAASYVTTHRHYSQRVDSPYTLARHLEERNKQLAEDQKKKASSGAEAELQDRIAAQKSSLYQQYASRLLSLPIVAIVKRRGVFTEEQINKAVRFLIDSAVDRVSEIERMFPNDVLIGDELDAAMQKKYEGIQFVLGGYTSVESYLDHCCTSEEAIANALLDSNDISDLSQMTGKSVEGLGGEFVLRFKETDYCKEIFKDVPLYEIFAKIGLFQCKLIAAQKKLIKQVSDLLDQAQDGGEYFRNLDSALGPFSFRMLGSEFAFNTDELKAFLAASNLDASGDVVKKKEVSPPKGEQKKTDESAVTLATAVKPLTTAASQTNTAESGSTDSEKPAVAEEIEEIRASREIERPEVNNIVLSMDDATVTVTFIREISKITPISGNSSDTGARIDRSYVVRFLSRLAEDPKVETNIVNYERVHMLIQVAVKASSFGNFLQQLIGKVSKSELIKALTDTGIS